MQAGRETDRETGKQADRQRDRESHSSSSSFKVLPLETAVHRVTHFPGKWG